MVAISMKRWSAAFLLAFFILVLSGCTQNATHEGIYVMFKGRTYIPKGDVYYHGKVIGQIESKEVNHSSIGKVSVRLIPEFEKQMGTNWAFYLKHGRMMAAKLYGSGRPLHAGDKVCGFNSKTAFYWFKFKTLLTDRVTRARMRADNLFRRFG